jgi:hypothetical protein
MRAFALKEGMGPLEDEHAGGLRDITSERRLGLIFDTQIRQAEDYGYWRQGQDPDVLHEWPAQRFIRVQEVKTERESHKQFEGQVYLKNDAVWAKQINHDFGVPWGPWGWGCGHDVEDEDRETAIGLGLMKAGDEAEPESRSFNENLRASAKGLCPELLEKLRRELGEQLEMDGDELRWAPAEAPRLEARESPVSEAIDVQAKGLLGEEAEAALAAIDKVHDDGELPGVPLRNTTRKVYGYTKIITSVDPADGSARSAAASIWVRDTGPWPTMTTAHEVGHLLDLEGIGDGECATTSGHAGMAAVLEAAEKTEAIKALRRLRGETISVEKKGHLDYLLMPEEIWARAYAQFIAQRSGFRSLARDLRRATESEAGRQWTAADFKPVADAIQKLMTELGWMQE